MDNPEGQVTYPIRNRTAGLPTSSSTFLGVHCVFIFVFIIKPYGTINLIRKIQIFCCFQSLRKTGSFQYAYPCYFDGNSHLCYYNIFFFFNRLFLFSILSFTFMKYSFQSLSVAAARFLAP